MDAQDFPAGYKADRELGEGSMGAVWLAWDPRRQGHCAIKVLNVREDRRGSAERSFNREVRAMARLQHPSVIEVFDFGRTPKGSPYVAMEYVAGTSLHSYTRGPWRWPQLWTLIDGLLGGLGHAHARDFIHRDLKPGNVLIVPEAAGREAVKLVDFGIALALSDAGSASRRIEGTPAYMAPEAAAGNMAQLGPWTDLYSLGVILFEILAGDLPFHGRHLLDHHQRSPLPDLRIRPDVEAPEGILAIVRRLLAKAPVARYRSVAELRFAFSALEPLPGPAVIGPPPGMFLWDDEEEAPVRPIRGASSPALVHLRQPEIVGRDDAQASLRRAADRAVAGEGPAIVLIEGEAGLGKSRLAGDLREWADETGKMRTLTVRSEPQTRAGGGLRQAVMRFLGAPTANEDDAEKVLRRALPPEAATNALDVLWRTTADGSDLRIRRAAQLIEDLAGTSPFIFWADDAQWSPEGRVLRLVQRLAQSRKAKHLLLVASLRPSGRSTVQAARRALLAMRGVEHVELAPLKPFDLAPALEALAPIPPGVAEAACVHAAGNPLLALEAVRAHLEAEGFDGPPTDPNAVLAQRIMNATDGELGSEMRSALARATLLGRSFALRPLARLCVVDGDPSAPALDGKPEQVVALLELAVDAGLATEQSTGRWRFSHDLVRAQFKQICRTLENWPALNLAAAKLKARRASADPTGIELEVVARHHWEGKDHVQGLRLGLEGIQRLHTAGLMGHATSFARRLLEWDDQKQLLSAADRCELHLLGSDAAEHAGQHPEAERHATQAVGIARRNYLPALGARAASRLGVLRLETEGANDAETWLWDALRFARTSGDDRARANAQLSLGRLYEHTEQTELATTAYEQSLDAAQDGGLLAEELAARSALARLDRVGGDLGYAVDAFERIANDAQGAGLEVAALDARLQLGLCAWQGQDPEAAAEAFESVREGARGNLFGMEFYAGLGAAWAQAARGDWRRAEMTLIQTEELRHDVRLQDAEAERLRAELRELAVKARRRDVVQRLDRLRVTSTRSQSGTHGGVTASR